MRAKVGEGVKDDCKLFFWATLCEIELSLTERMNSQDYLLPSLFIHSLRPYNLILLQTVNIHWTSKCLSVCLHCSILLLLSLKKLFLPLISKSCVTILVWPKSISSTFLSPFLFVTRFPLILLRKK